MIDLNRSHNYPNQMGRIILLSMEEILGHQGVAAILNHADLPQYAYDDPAGIQDMGFEFVDLSKVGLALEQLYGVRGGQGLALRSGRATFKYGLREFGSQIGWTDKAFRMLPVSIKLKTGSGMLAKAINQRFDQNVRFEEEEQRYLWHIDRCPLCLGRRTDHPVCHLAVGVLQEALFWVSCGKNYRVEETHCIARGDPSCTIAIDKQPLDG